MESLQNVVDLLMVKCIRVPVALLITQATAGDCPDSHRDSFVTALRVPKIFLEKPSLAMTGLLLSGI